MCGIIGMVAKKSAGFQYNHVGLFADMLVCDSIRGEDSTGVFGVLRNTQVRMLKQAAAPHVFMKLPGWSKFNDLMFKEMRMVIGHNRKATQGSISSENAHPFQRDNIILVHNGTISNHRQIHNTDVDSDAICHGFAELGVKETLTKINGAWALAWYDMKAKKLFLARNDQRPLAIAETEDLFLIASEGHMLTWLSKHSDMKLDRLISIEPKTLYEISINPFTQTTTPLDIDKAVIPFVPRLGPTVHHLPARQVETRSPTQGHNPGIRAGNLDAPYATSMYVVFVPESVAPDESDKNHPRIKAKGLAYLPGRPIAKASCFMPDGMTMEEAMDLCAPAKNDGFKKLTAKVRTFFADGPKSSDIVLFLEEPSEDSYINTWTGVKIPTFEYRFLTNHARCRKCAGRLTVGSTDFTSIQIKALNDIECVCPSCVMNNYDKMNPEMKLKMDRLITEEANRKRAGQDIDI